MNLQYAKATRVLLKQHPTFNEMWLQDRIAEDPSILGLGDLVLIERERRQERAGRLDLLLADLENNRRYEVELMLGATDESHIIRSIEYWDIERRRYPAYEHCAVLIAEDITSRFLNILGLFAGTIPIVAIQLSALQVGNNIVLDFAKVIDRTLLRTDDVSEVKLQATDREYWNKRATKTTVDMADDVLVIINEVAENPYALNYNKFYIGLNNGVRSTNFVELRPKKTFLRAKVKVAQAEEWLTKLDEAGLNAWLEDNAASFRAEPKEFNKHRELLGQLIQAACKEFEQ
jgi:hypothetical protein